MSGDTIHHEGNEIYAQGRVEFLCFMSYIIYPLVWLPLEIILSVSKIMLLAN